MGSIIRVSSTAFIRQLQLYHHRSSTWPPDCARLVGLSWARRGNLGPPESRPENGSSFDLDVSDIHNDASAAAAAATAEPASPSYQHPLLPRQAYPRALHPLPRPPPPPAFLPHPEQHPARGDRKHAGEGGAGQDWRSEHQRPHQAQAGAGTTSSKRAVAVAVAV